MKKIRDDWLSIPMVVSKAHCAIIVMYFTLFQVESAERVMVPGAALQTSSFEKSPEVPHKVRSQSAGAINDHIPLKERFFMEVP